jgi:hypothetical protein
MLPGDTLSREGCLAYFHGRVPGFHVGGKTALSWRGIRQNVSFREILTLWGDQPKRLPTWFTQRFPCRYQATQLFDEELRNGFGLQPLPSGRSDILVSVPERALLELLSDVGENSITPRSTANSWRVCKHCARRRWMSCSRIRRESR